MVDVVQFKCVCVFGMCVNFFVNYLYYWGDVYYSQIIGFDCVNWMDVVGFVWWFGILFVLYLDVLIMLLNLLFIVWCVVQCEMVLGCVFGEGEWLLVDDVLYVIMFGVVYMLWMDYFVGSIEVGKFVDFVVFDDDLLVCVFVCFKEFVVWGIVFGGCVFWLL